MTLLRRLPVALACLSLFIVVGCTRDEEPIQPVAFHPTTTTVQTTKKLPPPTTTIPEDTVTTTNVPPPRNDPPAQSVPPAPPKVDYQYGIPVPGKPGYVTSPYAPDSGYVDVHGFAPGQEVRDPYTQRIFLVP